MQNFYKVTQGNHGKVCSFATRLEGTLNQIWLKCPGWIANHARCHGTWRIVFSTGSTITSQDFIRYLHSNPETTCSQLVVTAPVRWKVRWRRQKIKLGPGQLLQQKCLMAQKELGNQITQLMAALTRSWTGPPPWKCSQIVPGTGVMGEDRQIGTLILTPAPTVVRLALSQTTSAHSSSASSRVGTAL